MKRFEGEMPWVALDLVGSRTWACCSNPRSQHHADALGPKTFNGMPKEVSRGQGAVHAGQHGYSDAEPRSFR